MNITPPKPVNMFSKDVEALLHGADKCTNSQCFYMVNHPDHYHAGDPAESHKFWTMSAEFRIGFLHAVYLMGIKLNSHGHEVIKTEGIDEYKSYI